MEKSACVWSTGATLEGAALAKALEKVITNYQEYLGRFEKRGLPREVVRILLDHDMVDRQILRQEEERLHGLKPGP